jgi:hypothetical protein
MNEQCYTFAEEQHIDWQETKNGQIEWFDLLDPSRQPIPSPCGHDAEECPAKKGQTQKAFEGRKK